MLSLDILFSHTLTLLTLTLLLSTYVRSSVFTAQCTLVHLRGLGIACRLSVRLSVRL